MRVNLVPDSVSDGSNSLTVVNSKAHLVNGCKIVIGNTMTHILPSRQQALSVYLK